MAFDREIAALTIACEAGNQSVECQTAVAGVLFNRLKLNPLRYGRSIAAVCLKRYQFSEWLPDVSDNALIERVAASSETSDVIVNALAAYDAALKGGDPSLGAVGFYATTIAEPAWASAATLTVQLGIVRFYKDVK